MRWMTLAFLLLVNSAAALASDLFADAKLNENFQKGAMIYDGITAGGYPIFLGDKDWYLQEAKVSENSSGTKFGTVRAISAEKKEFLAHAQMSVNLSASSLTNGFYTTDFCQKQLGIYFNKSRGGQFDDCMQISLHKFKLDATRETPLAVIEILNTKSSGRHYYYKLTLNLVTLGIASRAYDDWSEWEAPRYQRKQFLENLFAWAKQLQSAINTATEFNQPKDAFSGVPPLSSLFSNQ